MKPPSGAETPQSWYGQSMEHLLAIVQDLSEVRDVPAIARIVSDAGHRIVGSDGATFVLRDEEEVVCVEVVGTDEKWKGGRAPLDKSITGRAILTREPLLIEDIRTHPGMPAGAYRPGSPVSMVVMPIRKSDPIGAIVLFWLEPHVASHEELKILQALADITSVTWENVRLFAELQDKIHGLEAQQAQIREQHETLEVFTHALAHDLKEPVRTVRGFADLIAGQPGPSESNDAYFGFIRRAADRMAMLVDTVYAYTKLHDRRRFARQRCVMDEVLTGACDNLRQLMADKEAHIEASPLPVVEAHPGHMLQVMQNLIANAIKHSDIPVRIAVTAVDDGSDWHFVVRDNGPGIAEDDLERIFLPFKRLNLNEEGAGLGLAICARVIALHGGRLWCESTLGEGAAFHFTLPKVSLTDGPDNTAAAANDSGTGGLARVLLVDDREADIELTRILLRERDHAEFDLSVARSGSEALRMVREAKAAGAAYDVILLDINMPGMDGFETFQTLIEENTLNGTEVVMCTGSTRDSDIERAQALGARGYMLKPPSLAQLRPMLETVPALRWQDDGKAARLLRVA